MKSLDFHISIPAPNNFSAQISPGCPTDSISTYTDVPSQWTGVQPPLPHTAITRTPSFHSSIASTDHPCYRVQPGTYIAFEFDVEDAASHLAPHVDPKLPLSTDMRRFVGLVTHSFVFCPESGPWLGQRIEELTVNYVSTERPPIGALHEHAMPIYPSSVELGQSLETTTLFPWQDMFQWTTLGTRLYITEFYESTLNFQLKDDDFDRFDNKVVNDWPEMVSLQSSEAEPVDQTFQALQFPAHSRPAKVWRDVREANCLDDPCRFEEDLGMALANIVAD